MNPRDLRQIKVIINKAIAKAIAESITPLQQWCVNCTKGDRSRAAMTVYDGNALCAPCFMRAKPGVATEAETRKIERMYELEERKIKKQPPSKPDDGRWM